MVSSPQSAIPITPLMDKSPLVPKKKVLQDEICATTMSLRNDEVFDCDNEDTGDAPAQMSFFADEIEGSDMDLECEDSTDVGGADEEWECEDFAEYICTEIPVALSPLGASPSVQFNATGGVPVSIPAPVSDSEPALAPPALATASSAPLASATPNTPSLPVPVGRAVDNLAPTSSSDTDASAASIEPVAPFAGASDTPLASDGVANAKTQTIHSLGLVGVLLLGSLFLL